MPAPVAKGVVGGRERAVTALTDQQCREVLVAIIAEAERSPLSAAKIDGALMAALVDRLQRT